jgi:hypothetical protein
VDCAQGCLNGADDDLKHKKDSCRSGDKPVLLGMPSVFVSPFMRIGLLSDFILVVESVRKEYAHLVAINLVLGLMLLVLGLRVRIPLFGGFLDVHVVVIVGLRSEVSEGYIDRSENWAVYTGELVKVILNLRILVNWIQ